MWKRAKKYCKKLYKTLTMAEMGLLPASLAFYFVLAIIPIITITVVIASSFNISIDSVTGFIREIIPSQSADVLIDFVSGKGFDNSVGFFNVAAFVVALNGALAIIKVSNNMYKVEKSNAIKNIIKSVIILFIILLLIIFMILVPLFGEKILEIISSSNVLKGTIDELIILFKIIKWPLTFIIIYFNVKLIYTIAPNKQIYSKDTTYGAFSTTVLWILFTAFFGYYLKYFTRYDIVYGNLSSIIILMIWLYSLSYVFIFGIAINTTTYNNGELYKTVEIPVKEIKEEEEKEETKEDSEPLAELVKETKKKRHKRSKKGNNKKEQSE